MKLTKYTENIVHQVGFICRIIRRCTVNRTKFKDSHYLR